MMKHRNLEAVRERERERAVLLKEVLFVIQK